MPAFRVTNADGSQQNVNCAPWAVGEMQDWLRKQGATVEALNYKATAFMVFAQIYIDTYPETPVTFDKWFRSILDIQDAEDDDAADRPTKTASDG